MITLLDPQNEDNRATTDKYQAALIALARARRGPWQQYRDALVLLTEAKREMEVAN